MAHELTPRFNLTTFLAKVNGGKRILQAKEKQIIFSQGDAADAVFAILERGAFFGESCLTGQMVRVATATALDVSTILRIGKPTMIRTLHDEPTLAERFITYLLTRNLRIESDLVDQLFNSSEKRLARMLLLLAHFGKETKPEPIMPKISQETLAKMVGTTRPRISFFMNKFKKLGFIHDDNGLHVHGSLLNIVLHD